MRLSLKINVTLHCVNWQRPFPVNYIKRSIIGACGVCVCVIYRLLRPDKGDKALMVTFLLAVTELCGSSCASEGKKVYEKVKRMCSAFRGCLAYSNDGLTQKLTWRIRGELSWSWAGLYLLPKTVPRIMKPAGVQGGGRGLTKADLPNKAVEAVRQATQAFTIVCAMP